MTNLIAFIVALIVVGAIAADILLNDGTALLFMGKKMSDAIEWLAFWR